MKSIQPKKIAIVANTTWNIYNFRLNIIRKLISEGHEVVVIAPVDKYIVYTESIREVEHVPMHNMKRNSMNPLSDILLLFELVRLYRKVKPDVLLHYTVKCNVYGGFAARWLRIPSLAVVTGVGHPMIKRGWLKSLVTWLYRLSLPCHHTVIFENQDDKKLFDAGGLTRQDQSKSVKGCGVDVSDFMPAERPEPNGKITFSFIGRLIYDKGVKEFIEAAQAIKKKYQGLQFWLVGDIDEGNPSSVRNEELMYWIRDPDIHYHGATDQVKFYYAQSDCIVLPSYPAEGLPKVLMEAMAMERPVITTDTPGCREAVDDGVNGFLVPYQDAKALALSMERFILLDKTERQKMGKNAREKTLLEFDERIIVEQLYDFIKLASEPENK